MTAIAVLAFAYVLSQFYRSFLAVLAPVLARDIGAEAADLARASGIWFLAFALMQVPVGLALDRFGPRRTAALLIALGGAGGAQLLALAEGPLGLALAMALIGTGCAPVLMAAYFLVARLHPARRFATIAGALVGIGSLGNLVGAAPLAAAVTAFGWRATMSGLALVTLLAALAVLLLARDPPRAAASAEAAGLRGYLALFRIRGLWPVLPMMAVNYAPAAGVRGLWAGPWLEDAFGLGLGGIGEVTFAMAVAMIAGNILYGPLDRLVRARKPVVLVGNLLAAACCLLLAALPSGPFPVAVAGLVGLGLFGATFAVVVAHGRAFLPPELTGRGITLLNFFGIGWVGVMQLVTGALHGAGGGGGPVSWSLVFGAYGLTLLLGCLAYLASRDRTD